MNNVSNNTSLCINFSHTQTLLKIIKIIRVVTKVSSCWENTTIRQGIRQLGVAFGSIFFYFLLKEAGGHVYSSQGKSPAPTS